MEAESFGLLRGEDIGDPVEEPIEVALLGFRGLLGSERIDPVELTDACDLRGDDPPAEEETAELAEFNDSMPAVSGSFLLGDIVS